MCNLHNDVMVLMFFIVVANIILSETNLLLYCKKQVKEKNIKKYKSNFLIIYYIPVCNAVCNAVSTIIFVIF